MRKESINGLQELTGFDRRTIKSKIAHLEAEKRGKALMYFTNEALPAIYLGSGNLYDIERERSRLLHHQANIAGLDEEVKKKNLIPSEIVIDRWQNIAANIRAKLLSIPSILAASGEGLEKKELERIASNLIKAALQELSENIEY